MKQIELFGSNDLTVLEKEVNEFLSRNDIIDIKLDTFITIVGDSHTTIMVTYNKKS